MIEILTEYREKFGEAFPLMLTRHMTEKQIIETVEDCIRTGKPYTPELEPDSFY